MTKKQMTVKDEETLRFVFIFFSAVGKFSMTVEEFVEAEEKEFGYCPHDLEEITDQLEEAQRIGIVLKHDSLFILNLDDELVSEMIAKQIKNKEFYIKNVESNIQFLEGYRQQKSRQ